MNLRLQHTYNEHKKGGENMNQVGLVGRLTKTPELKYYNEKRPYTTFTLAINRPYRNQTGQYESDFVQCSAWGKLAESITKHCGKGSLIGVNGRLNSRSYTNKENERIFTLDVLAEAVRFYALKGRDQSIDLSEFVDREEEIQGHSSELQSNPQIVAERKEQLQKSKKQSLPIPS